LEAQVVRVVISLDVPEADRAPAGDCVFGELDRGHAAVQPSEQVIQALVPDEKVTPDEVASSLELASAMERA
jgi:hypothetical protein